MIRLGAGLAQLGVVAGVKVPVALELGARGASGKFLVDIVRSHIAMLLHVIEGDLIRDALVAESRHQPIEDRRGVALSHCCPDTTSIKVGANVVDQVRGTGETADPVDQSHRMIDRGCSVVNLGMVFRLL